MSNGDPPCPTDPALVQAVVLNWNGAAQTIACLRALQRVAYPRLRVLVVDNGSSDGSVACLRDAMPDLDLVCAARNQGFAAGCNIGIARAYAADADYVWLLNNDARAHPGALAALVARAAADPRVAAVGSILTGDAGGAPPVWGGGSVSFVSGLARHHARAIDDARVDYLEAASVLLRCTALRAVGPLDEGFFLYWEDVDLCFRLRRAGWRVAVAGDALVEHPGHGSLRFQSPEWDYHFTASSVRFFRRHAALPLLPIAVSAGGRLVRRALGGRWANVRAVAAGLRAAAARPAVVR